MVLGPLPLSHQPPLHAGLSLGLCRAELGVGDRAVQG